MWKESIKRASFVDGKYKDGSIIFVPFTSKSQMFNSYDATAIIYSTQEEAKKRKDLLLRQNDTYHITIEKL